MKHIEINGKEYPFKVSYSVIRKVMSMGLQGELDQAHFICVEAINKGFRMEGKEPTMTGDLLDDLIDEDPLAMERLTAAIDEQQKTEGGSAEDEGK